MASFLKMLPLALVLGCGAASAQEVQKVDPSSSIQQKAERGWFFYEDPVKPKDTKKPNKKPPEQQQQAEAPKPEKEKCRDMETWTPECGFVDPGTSFEFQAKQRDALLERMTMSKNDPKAVEAFQYYMKWVVGRATEVANLWYYNMVQNPDLDASVSQPVSSFGLRLMTDVKKGHAEEIFNSLKNDDAMLVYFSRADCSFCHHMSPSIKNIAKRMNLPVWNAALDETCMPGFEGKCETGKVVEKPAQALQVTTVPSLFLHVPPKTWIRLSTGVTDEESIMARTVSFFSAYRTALLKGVANGEGIRSSVDFSGEDSVSGTAEGVTPSRTPRAPSESEIRAMLGAK